MRRVLLLLLFSVSLIGCVASRSSSTVPGRTDVSLPPVAQVRNDEVTAITIDDNQGGWSRDSSISAHYDLKPAADGFVGTAGFLVRSHITETEKATADIVVPAPVIQRFLQSLGTAPVIAPVFKPVPTWTDGGGRSISVGIGTWSNVSYQSETVFHTDSYQRDYVPWLVLVNKGKDGMIDSDAPTTAYALLLPYLKQDMLKQMADAAKRRYYRR